MHLLWIIIVLALFKCNYGQQEEATVSDDLIDLVFSREKMPENEVTAGPFSRPPSPPPPPITPDKPKFDTPITENPSLEPKVSNPCEVGECSPYYLCLNGTIITSGIGVLDVRIAEFPWAVAIIHNAHDKDGILNVYKCGGSLIHPGVVITAARCVINLKETHEMIIRAGEWDTQTVNEPYPHQDRAVADVVIHEEYTSGSLFNDIALLFLAKPVDLAENVNTACLPPQDYNFDRQRCYATGWGKDKFGKEGLYQVILKRIELPVVPRSECELELRDTRLGKHFLLHPSFICAGGESGKDTCQGDGGSPLSCEVPDSEHGQYYLAGEVAWGIGCHDPIPGVYVNVAKFWHWVDKIFDERKIEQKYYIAL